MSKPCAPAAPQRNVPLYQRPTVKDLGAWQALTLIYSLPIGPGGQAITESTRNF